MPLERKILLSILIGIIIIFGGYLLYDSYYPGYKDALKRIEQYKTLIEKNSKEPTEITEENIQQLKDLKEYYEDRFFTEAQSAVTATTPAIKKRLEFHGIKISQYQGSKESVRFTITGSKSSLLNFLYSLSKDEMEYDFPLFNLRMVDNSNFQGTIEISRPTLKHEPRDASYYEDLGNKKEQFSYSTRALAPLGVSFYVKPKEPISIEPVVIEDVPEVIPNKRLDKFTYVGLLKKDNITITMFKEKVNGRVYRFEENKTISGWTYIGEENNKYLFTKDDITYEVIP